MTGRWWTERSTGKNREVQHAIIQDRLRFQEFHVGVEQGLEGQLELAGRQERTREVDDPRIKDGASSKFTLRPTGFPRVRLRV
jgi:hypothetical protein